MTLETKNMRKQQFAKQISGFRMFSGLRELRRQRSNPCLVTDSEKPDFGNKKDEKGAPWLKVYTLRILR